MRKDPNFNKELFKKYYKKKIKTDDGSLPKNHILIIYVKIITALKLLFVTELVFAIIGAVIIYNSNLTWSDWQLKGLLIVGLFVGFILIYFITRNRDLDDLVGGEYQSHDIDDIILKEQENKKNENS